MHYLLCLIVHLHLLLGVSIVCEHIHMRYHIVGKLIGKLLHRRLLAALELRILTYKLIHSSRTGSARSLICGNVHPFYRAYVIDGLERHHHLYCGAIRVGYYITGSIERIVAIHLWHHQGHIAVHTERA